MSLSILAGAPRLGTTVHRSTEVRRVGTMSTIQRLRLVGATLALLAAITCTQVLGDVSKDRSPMQPACRKDSGPRDVKVGESLAASKFAEQPVVAYKTRSGELVVGAQLKPDLCAALT